MKIYSILFLLICTMWIGCSSTQRFSRNEGGIDNTTLKIIEGEASYYSEEFHGRKTANGETYDMYGLTAAHKTLPFNTEIRVTNRSNGKSVILRINDRMPAYSKREIDLSFQAAKKIDMLITGIAVVKIEVLKWGDGK